MKTLYYLLSLIFSIYTLDSLAQNSEILSAKIKTVQLLANDDYRSAPILHLNSDDYIEVSFDELSHDYNQYYYEVKHLSAEYTPSNLSEIDYINGFYTNYIDNYESSINTTVPYTHYSFKLPNDNIQFKLSGNYQLTVYDADSQEPVFISYFNIIDERSSIDAQITTNTSIDNNKNHQQVNFVVKHRDLNTRNVQQEFKVRVLQNRRNDNAVTDIMPTYISSAELQYMNNRKLIFEAGNEYRRFETVSNRNYGLNIESLEYIAPFYHATLHLDSRRENNYIFMHDMNGHYLVESDEAVDSNVEADYYFVHFTLEDDSPFETGKVYLNGAFTYDNFNSDSEMKFNWETYCYEGTLLLKQGSYNYQYLLVNNKRGEAGPIEGNYAETENEYEIYIYFRAPNGRYDQLIGYKRIRFKP